MRKSIIYIIGMAAVLAGCSREEALRDAGAEGGSGAAGGVGQPVLFSSGAVGHSETRAATPYMALNGRFVCTMYYHPAAGATDASPYDVRPVSEGGTMNTAWLMVNNNIGNSVYRKASFSTPTKVDAALQFDNDATIFYWQNRLTHAFLALADYNQLTTNDGSSFTTQGKLKLFPYGDKIESVEEVEAKDGAGNTLYEDDGVTPKTTTVTEYDQTYNSYDLTRKARNLYTNMPDPIMALTIQKPEGATQEANRVRLYFKHQFSQIQVNLKGASDESATLTADQIKKVELLGVSEEGYVKNILNADGTVGAVPGGSPAGTMGAADYKPVDLYEYTDEHLENNRWGTSFEMFDMGDTNGDGSSDTSDHYAAGYLKSYNAIAFGQLWGIRVTWRERTGEILHVTTYEVPMQNETKVDLRNLASGMKYIYNLELRRGTLAIIRTEILDWQQEEPLVYTQDGTITN